MKSLRIFFVKLVEDEISSKTRSFVDILKISTHTPIIPGIASPNLLGFDQNSLGFEEFDDFEC